jgi:hypothetical protein
MKRRFSALAAMAMAAGALLAGATAIALDSNDLTCAKARTCGITTVQLVGKPNSVDYHDM